MRSAWTPEEEELLRKNYPLLSAVELGAIFPNKTSTVIRSKAKVLKLTKLKKKFYFSPEQTEELIKIYPTTSNDDIAAKFGCTRRSVNGIASKMGLKKDPEYMLRITQKLAKDLGESGKGFRFKQGNTPPNKGKKMDEFMTPEQMIQFKLHQKKKGDRPHNWLPVGSEVITDEGYVTVKLAEGMYNWEHKHRIVWELHHGPIPKGYNVQFKDGNRLNCDDVKNLYLISREEQLRTENTICRYPNELRTAISYLSKLNKQIQKHETDKSRRIEQFADGNNRDAEE